MYYTTTDRAMLPREPFDTTVYADGDDVTVLQARPVDVDAASDPQFPLSLLRYGNYLLRTSHKRSKQLDTAVASARLRTRRRFA